MGDGGRIKGDWDEWLKGEELLVSTDPSRRGRETVSCTFLNDGSYKERISILGNALTYPRTFSQVPITNSVPMVTDKNALELDAKEGEKEKAELVGEYHTQAVCKRANEADNLDAVGAKRAKVGLITGEEVETNGSVEQRNPSRGLQGEESESVQRNHGGKVCPDNGRESYVLTPSTTKGAAKNEPSGLIKLIAEVAEDRGSRHTMEDTWVLLTDAWQGSAGSLRCAHFAIYDGHGGRHAAEYARAHLHTNVLSAGLPRESVDIKSVKRAIIAGFKSTDDALLRESTAGGWQDGATAVCVWVLGQMVFVANVGDAKAVLARVSPKSDGEGIIGDKTGSDVDQLLPLKGVVVTREHKAIYPQERTRIQKAGGYVEANGRMLGRLEVSRAFGDRIFKKAGVIVTPDVHVFELTERERFLILGCDGLWGVFGPSDAVDFISTQFKEGASVSLACKRLVREAVRERKCKDNCTAIVIKFEHLSS
ncbi:hypothetical protein R1flu_023736 [Riccia fluitans]|uniref:PPM-type phosphatase domain-containing protein n=1 Tax=Riccia fluitans TaxID=41844 RepID=A0ABD1XTD4_9MARC